MESSISWQAYEYFHEPKTSDWYWALGVVSIAIAGAAVIFGNIIFALLVIISAAALAMHAHKEPKLVEFELNEKGVRIEKTFYPYSTLESFAIETHETEMGLFAKLFIKSKKTFMPLIIMPIAEIHPEDVQEYISIFLTEEEHRESMPEKVMEWLGF